MVDMPTDPQSPTYNCDMAAYWREQYANVIAGRGEKMVRYRGPNGEEEVQLNPANLDAIHRQIVYWEGLCAGTGAANTSRRYAITAGSMRGCGYWSR